MCVQPFELGHIFWQGWVFTFDLRLLSVPENSFCRYISIYSYYISPIYCLACWRSAQTWPYVRGCFSILGSHTYYESHILLSHRKLLICNRWFAIVVLKYSFHDNAKLMWSQFTLSLWFTKNRDFWEPAVFSKRHEHDSPSMPDWHYLQALWKLRFKRDHLRMIELKTMCTL